MKIHPDLNESLNMGRNWVQFPRIINAIVHTQKLDVSALAEFMDLSLTQTYAILHRADQIHEINTTKE